MAKFPSALEISPEDFRRLQVLKLIRQRIEQTNRNPLEIWFYDPVKDGNAFGESPANPAFVLCEVSWLWWGGTVPYRHRKFICAVMLENWDTISLNFWQIFDHRWSKIIAELSAPLAHNG